MVSQRSLEEKGKKRVLSTYFVLGILYSFFPVLLMAVLRGKYAYLQFTD